MKTSTLFALAFSAAISCFTGSATAQSADISVVETTLQIQLNCVAGTGSLMETHRNESTHWIEIAAQHNRGTSQPFVPRFHAGAAPFENPGGSLTQIVDYDQYPLQILIPDSAIIPRDALLRGERQQFIA